MEVEMEKELLNKLSMNLQLLASEGEERDNLEEIDNKEEDNKGNKEEKKEKFYSQKEFDELLMKTVNKKLSKLEDKVISNVKNKGLAGFIEYQFNTPETCILDYYINTNDLKYYPYWKK